MFSSFERRISLAAAVAGLVSFLGWAIEVFFSYGLSRYIDPSFVLYISIALFAASITYGAMQVIGVCSAIYRTPQVIHGTSRSVVEIEDKLLDCLLETRDHSELNLNHELVNICNQIRDYFDKLTRSPCAVCIKMLVEGESPIGHHVFTLVRDSKSKHERDALDRERPSYPYVQNTAFHHIISKEGPYCYFWCNNLKELDRRELLNTGNPKWSEYYRAVFVVPIARADNPNLDDATGFLCVDNKRGRFPRKISTDVLGSVGKQIYFLLTFNRYVRSKLGEETMQSEDIVRSSPGQARG